MRPSRRLCSWILAAFTLGIALAAYAAFTAPTAVPYNAAAYLDRAKLINSTGTTALGAYASPAACAAAANLFSQNIAYSLPILSLPGRGLGMSLTLAYNSKVWIKSGSTIYFDGDVGWPAPGWRLGFGRIDGKYTYSSVDHYFLVSGDGSVRDLKYNSTSGKYESQDSSYIDFDDSTGILRTKDGTQITYAANNGSGSFVMPTQIKDRNGNYITIAYNTTGQQISSITDTVGRVTSFSYNGNGTLNTVTKSGFGNSSRTWTFGYSDVTITYNFGSLTVNGPTSGSSVKMLTSITYPNNTKHEFSYSTYGQLTEVAWKSSNNTLRGKPLLVTWQSVPQGGWSDSPTPSKVSHNDGSTTTDWTLTFNSYSTTVTDPASVARITSFRQTGAWDDGLPSQTQIGSTALRTSANTWGHDGNSINPRVTAVTTTLSDATPNLISKVEYDYTTYGNVSEVREYDYGSGAAGAQKRKTITTYETGTNYTSRRILSMPLTTIVYDGVPTAKSRTEFAYDGATLVSATGASNHDDTNYGTTFAYRGLVTQVTRYTNAATPSGAISNTMTYDMLGNMRTESADCCVTKSYTYTSTTQFSQPDSVVRGSGTTLTTSSTYDSYTGLLASSTDENSKTTSYSYDVTDRLTTTTRSDSTQFTTSFDDAAATPSRTSTMPIEASKSIKQKTETDGLGRTTRSITMDNSSNVISKVDTVYDSVSRVWKVSNPYTGASPSYWTETQYDALGRALKVIPPDGTSSSNRIVYTYAGDTITAEDQTGRKRKSKGDALGRMIEVTEPDPANSDSLTLTTSYTYDPMNNLTQVSQGSQTRTYEFDGLSRKTSETTPEAGQVTFSYNSDSLLTSRTDARGVVTTYTYDSSLNRLTQISYNVSCCSTVASTNSVGYTYGTSSASNNNGRLTQMTDGPGQENYTYDSLGRMTQVQKKIYNVTYTTSYTYNLAGEVATMTYPSGRVVKQEYDAIGRVQNVKNNTTSANYATSATYNTAGQVTGFTYGNSVSASFGYSADRLQMTSLSYTKSPITHLSLSYSYSQSGNNNGQIAGITDNQQSGRTVACTYDSLHRLKTAVTNGSAGYPQWGLSWVYDRWGNRKEQNRTHGTAAPTNVVTISESTNRITAMGSFNFSYDANGSLTQDDLYKYKYDAENRLVEIRLVNNTLVSTYAYDGNSLRVIKVVGADRTWYLYAGGQVVSEFEDAASNTYSSGTNPGSAPSDSVSTLVYQHGDHLTSRITTDQQGNVANQQAHYPYGENWYATGTADPSVLRKFTSYEKDAEVASGQLHYAVFRTHGARIGRFNRPDPVQGGGGDPQGLNRYAYVKGNPINFIDPNGLIEESVYGPPHMEGGGDGSVYFGSTYSSAWIIGDYLGAPTQPFSGGGGGGFPFNVPIILISIRTTTYRLAYRGYALSIWEKDCVSTCGSRIVVEPLPYRGYIAKPYTICEYLYTTVISVSGTFRVCSPGICHESSKPEPCS
jgi:RHS repeat-associated protein